MADCNDVIIKKSVRNIFEEMEYGFNEEIPELALKWIENNHKWINYMVGYCGKTTDFQSVSEVNFLNSSTKLNYPDSGNEEWLKADKFCKIQVFQRLAFLLKQNSTLFAQLDSLERNIPVHDILQYDIPYFIQYFESCAFMPLKLSKFTKKINWTKDRIDCLKITRLLPFHDICWNISPYLICGQTVKLAVDYKSVVVTLLFIKLCHEAGIPEDVLRLESITSMSDNPGCFSQSVALIFDNVDLNSVVDSVTEGAWSHHGLVPWSLRRILVQESIYNVFKKKLLIRMKNLRCGNVFNRLINFGKPDSSQIENFQAIVSEAKSEGFEVHQVHGIDDGFIKPTLIIGRPQCLFESISPQPVITVEGFRTLEESIKLVKNGNFVKSASLWTNSYSVLERSTRYLMSDTDIQTVWFNKHGVLDPLVPVAVQDILHSVKNDLLSYLFKNAFPEITLLFNPEVQDVITKIDQKDLNEIENILLTSSKAQSVWNKLGPLKRSLILSDAAVKLWKEKTKFESYLVNESSDNDQSIEALVEFMINISSCDHLPTISSCTARGVIVIVVPKVKNLYIFLQLLLTFVFYGNSVIIITDGDDKINVFNDIVKDYFPLYLVRIMNCISLNSESINSDLIPDLEVLSVNAFISKMTWSMN